MEFVASENGKAAESAPLQTKNSFVVSEVSGGLCTLVSDCLHVVEWPLSLLPFDVKKGMVLSLDIVRDTKEEAKREKKLKNMQADLSKSSEA